MNRRSSEFIAQTPAPPRVLDKVYGWLVEQLTLDPYHWSLLRAHRQLSEEVISRLQFRSWPGDRQSRERIAARMEERFGVCCSGVPGWYNEGVPALSGHSGWCLPLRDPASRIVAIRIRSDGENPKPKYTWLSSAKRKCGTGATAQAFLAWPGRLPTDSDRAVLVRLTEGETKATTLAEHDGVPTLSVPGVDTWRLALPWLAHLRACKVQLCFDRDFETNPRVAKAFLNVRTALVQRGYEVRLGTWGRAIL